MATPTPAKHTGHTWIWTEGYRPVGECPRCDFLRAAKAADGETPHNHERMPFGRRVDGCLRCSELADGMPKREGFKDRQDRLDAERTAAIRAHTNETCHYMSRTPSGHWIGVCVCFDW